MQKFFDDTPSGSSIIAREDVLLPLYQPDELRYRGNELQVMADAVKPLLRKRECMNLLIHGKSGTGKTSCAKAIMKQLSEHSPVVLPVYANCWESPTRAAVFAFRECEFRRWADPTAWAGSGSLNTTNPA